MATEERARSGAHEHGGMHAAACSMGVWHLAVRRSRAGCQSTSPTPALQIGLRYHHDEASSQEAPCPRLSEAVWPQPHRQWLHIKGRKHGARHRPTQPLAAHPQHQCKRSRGQGSEMGGCTGAGGSGVGACRQHRAKGTRQGRSDSLSVWPVACRRLARPCYEAGDEAKAPATGCRLRLPPKGRPVYEVLVHSRGGPALRLRTKGAANSEAQANFDATLT
jgi:hypothetical protein